MNIFIDMSKNKEKGSLKLQEHRLNLLEYQIKSKLHLCKIIDCNHCVKIKQTEDEILEVKNTIEKLKKIIVLQEIKKINSVMPKNIPPAKNKNNKI